MSERQSLCQALAAMIHSAHTSDKPSVDELRFIAHVALELGLDEKENAAVQATLEGGGSFEELVPQVKNRDMQLFLFRQIVAAALIDEQIDDSEHAFINGAAEALGIDEASRAAFVSWMHEGIEWERKGAALLAQLRE